MSRVDPEVLDGVLELLSELSGDWEYDGEITPETRFLADLGLESLDIVVLGTMIQQRYGRLPFAEYLEELGQRPVEERDVYVAELVAFVCEHRRPSLGGGVTMGPTLLIGLDGATFAVLDPLHGAWRHAVPRRSHRARGARSRSDR